MKRPSALRAAFARPGTLLVPASHTSCPWSFAYVEHRDIDVCPMPRLGEFTMRVKAFRPSG